MSRATFLRGTAALAVLGTIAGCTPDASVNLTNASGGIFESYVAIGNSITAGYYSSGLNAAQQRTAYPVLLAAKMDTRFAIPLLADPGCAPPVINWQTGSRGSAGGTTFTSTTCALRSGFTDIINNVGVPDAATVDAIAEGGTPRSNVLTQLFLGGSSQVQRALQAEPTFATVWIGNNDILSAAGSGILVPTSGVPGLGTPPTYSAPAAFTARIDTLFSELTAGAPGIKGVGIGVVNVKNTPLAFPGAALANPQFLAGARAVAGTPFVVHPSCTATTTSLLTLPILSAIRAGTHPAVVACEKGAVPGTPVGDAFVLDAAEQATIDATVTAYNAAIKAEADAAGWAYLDPNPVLATLRAPGAACSIATIPNFASATAPYGTCIGLDPVHPNATGHIQIANALIDVINAKYGTSLTKY